MAGIRYFYRKNRMEVPEQYQTYIDIAWQAHAEKLEELNALSFARQVIEAQEARARLELEELAEQAGQALPWGPEVEQEQQ